MLTFWGIVTAITMVGGVPIVAGLWTIEQWRSRRRARNGQCAACGVAWSSIQSVDPYLIQGRLVCEACGEKARRRMPWHFGVLALATAVGTGLAVAGAELAVMIFLPICSTFVMTVGAVQLMKSANRTALRRIATGELPPDDSHTTR